MCNISDKELKEIILNSLVEGPRSGEEYSGLVKQVDNFIKNFREIQSDKKLPWAPFYSFTKGEIVELANLFIKRDVSDKKLMRSQDLFSQSQIMT